MREIQTGPKGQCLSRDEEPAGVRRNTKGRLWEEKEEKRRMKNVWD